MAVKITQILFANFLLLEKAVWKITEEEITNVLHEKYIMENDDVENKWELCFCMEDKENAEYVKLPCEHIFHTQCIAKWLTTNNSCPNCRERNIIVKNDFIRS